MPRSAIERQLTNDEDKRRTALMDGARRGDAESIRLLHAEYRLTITVFKKGKPK